MFTSRCSGGADNPAMKLDYRVQAVIAAYDAGLVQPHT
jgi:hypothetical protein